MCTSTNTWHRTVTHLEDLAFLMALVSHRYLSSLKNKFMVKTSGCIKIMVQPSVTCKIVTILTSGLEAVMKVLAHFQSRVMNNSTSTCLLLFIQTLLIINRSGSLGHLNHRTTCSRRVKGTLICNHNVSTILLATQNSRILTKIKLFLRETINT